MIRTWTIIGVCDVRASHAWYQTLFGQPSSAPAHDHFGQLVDEDGTVLGKTHQAFLDLKAAVTGRDDKAIINEVERGEDYLKEKFEAALAGDKLTTESREIVERAYQSVRKGHDQISQLKHGLEA